MVMPPMRLPNGLVVLTGQSPSQSIGFLVPA
jgi:hypothetical protein